jgi:thiamine transport system permease protein
VFLARADAPTLPVAIARLLGRPGEATVGQAYAASVLLLVVTAAVVVVIDRARTTRLGEF